MDESPPSLLTVPEVATYLRTTPAAAQKMIERGQIPASCVVRLGRRVLVRRDDLRRWVGVISNYQEEQQGKGKAECTSQK